ncbi:MAG: hypothetical protein RLZZ241_2053 [Bacteroidota bacterium]|jgi:hypothetical protein
MFVKTNKSNIQGKYILVVRQIAAQVVNFNSAYVDI